MSIAVIVIGAGGHGTVVADALIQSGADVLGFTDPDPNLHGTHRCDRPILGDDRVLARHDFAAVLLANGIGGVRAHADGGPRARVQRQLEAQGWRFTAVRHPTAIVSPFARLGSSCQVLAGAVVQAHALIGTGVIVNTAAVVEHDVSVGDWTHVASRAVICGNALIGPGCHVGANAVVRQGIRLGAEVTVGIGAAVVKDQFAPGTLAGVPARMRDQEA